MLAAPSNRRVVITGLGAVTPVGLSAPATWASLVAGQSGIGPITHFDPTGCTARIAGEVRGFDPTAAIANPVHPRGPGSEPVTQALTPKDIRKLGRFTHLGVSASLEAYIDSGIDAARAELPSERIGVNLGVGLGGLPEIVAMHDIWKAGGFRKISPFFILQSAPNILAGQAAILLNCRGPNMSIASACATSGHSLGESAKAIARGDADVMVAGGAEAVITPVAVGAFAQMKALSTRNEEPARASRPYDQDRDGFVIGEGAVVFILEELEFARRRGARIYAEVAGYGASADAFHLSSLAPEAEGSRRSMQLALQDGALAPERVGYVSAHATSTPGGDGEEGAAIAAVFGAVKDRLHVSAIKSMTGHLLGAAGALGAFAAVKAIETGTIAPTLNLEKVEAALANSFGFGGTNASLVFTRL
jgi:3-oxoacyl-[acyl-carrier-protein] synthase II